MATKQLGKLLNPSENGELGGSVRSAHEMGELTTILARSLPDDHAGAILAANLRDGGELVVIAASPAWASRLRFEADDLLQTARNAGIEAASCRIRVTQG